MPDPILASHVEPEKIDFIWRHRVPRGMITVLAGRPDQGKGLLAAHIAAQVSRGLCDDDGNVICPGERVLYSAAEDKRGGMTRPRLEAAGANLDNIWLWRFALPVNYAELADIVKRENIGLIVMDPFGSHLSKGASRHSDSARLVLGPFAELIESTNTAVLIVEHALKRVAKNSDPLSAIGGTALPQFARAAFVFGRDPDDEDRRVLIQAKFNVGMSPQPLAFELDVAELDPVGDVPLLVPGEELPDFDPMKLFELQPKSTQGRPLDKRAAAAEWLTTYLIEAGGPVPAGTVQEDAKHYGLSCKTLRRAADDMGVVRNPPAGGRNCTWDLPDDVKELMGIEPDGGTPVPVPDDPSGLDDPSDLPEQALTLTDDDLTMLLGDGDDNDA